MCDREGYEVFKIYDDRGISGKSIKGRPALQQLLRDANEHAFDMVLVWKMNRFSRKTLDLLTIVDLLKKKHISFRSLTERHETETPSGVMQFQMMAIIAEFERANIAENVKMGMIARAREGSWNGGQVLGYDVVGHFDDNRKRKQSKLVETVLVLMPYRQKEPRNDDDGRSSNLSADPAAIRNEGVREARGAHCLFSLI
ncbi:recombinase family protein [Bacillus subtilis]|uniref:recombinase family protein n=1 Tax=Bacillus subtilis TaxID=1423 RepID=UPI001374904E|nr:recombinase family protein [Bacillus subtilis]QHQ82455.1 hypothetical protein GPJ55_23130 [Bacillus subtilis]